jgi:hypothetical protein
VPGVAPGEGRDNPAAGPARLEDVAVTVLHMLGVPISRSLQGTVRAELLPRQLLAEHPVRFVEDYGRRDLARPAASAPAGHTLDDEMRERLRSLGYVR